MPGQNYYTAAKEHLAVEAIGDELLIYDRRSDVAHCLGEVAACVWSRCQGGASLDELVIAVAPLTDAADAERLVLSALGELQEKDLLETRGVPAGVSRRDVLKRVAGVGAAATMVPLVISAAVPKSADAMASPTAGACHTTGQSCFAPSSPQSAYNGCCSTSQGGGTGYYCSTGPPSVCLQCLAPGTTCTSNAKFQCCSNSCVSNGGSKTCA